MLLILEQQKKKLNFLKNSYQTKFLLYSWNFFFSTNQMRLPLLKHKKIGFLFFIFSFFLKNKKFKTVKNIA